MTIVVDGDQVSVERLTSYLYKLVNVIQVDDLTGKPMVSRDLAMIKVSTNAENRAEIIQMADVFRARVVDVTANSLIIEVTGDEDKIDGLVEVLKPFGIIEMVRTGAVAMSRGSEALMNGKECEPASAGECCLENYHQRMQRRCRATAKFSFGGVEEEIVTRKE